MKYLLVLSMVGNWPAEGASRRLGDPAQVPHQKVAAVVKGVRSGKRSEMKITLRMTCLERRKR